jgi:hypothetical protein
MATLTETVGSATANSYATAEEALAYFEARLGGEKWPAGAAAATKALLTAMRILEGLRFKGRRVDATQALNWPRVANTPQERGWGDASPYIASTSLGLVAGNGRNYATTAIPQPIKDAQCEIAYAMILDPSLNDPALIQATLKTGNLTIDHRSPAATRLRMAYECLSGLVLHGTQLQRA